MTNEIKIEQLHTYFLRLCGEGKTCIVLCYLEIVRLQIKLSNSYRGVHSACGMPGAHPNSHYINYTGVPRHIPEI